MLEIIFLVKINRVWDVYIGQKHSRLRWSASLHRKSVCVCNDNIHTMEWHPQILKQYYLYKLIRECLKRFYIYLYLFTWQSDTQKQFSYPLPYSWNGWNSLGWTRPMPRARNPVLVCYKGGKCRCQELELFSTVFPGVLTGSSIVSKAAGTQTSSPTRWQCCEQQLTDCHDS